MRVEESETHATLLTGMFTIEDMLLALESEIEANYDPLTTPLPTRKSPTSVVRAPPPY